MPATGPWTYTPGADVPDDDRRVTIPAFGPLAEAFASEVDR